MKFLSQEKNAIQKPEPEKESKKITRREFLKYGVGVAAVAAKVRRQNSTCEGSCKPSREHRSAVYSQVYRPGELRDT